MADGHSDGTAASRASTLSTDSAASAASTASAASAAASAAASWQFFHICCSLIASSCQSLQSPLMQSRRSSHCR